MENKLKITESVTIYSTENTWETYKGIIIPIKLAILNGQAKVTDVKYSNDFDKKYKPYANENNWGSNLDEFKVKIYSNYEAVFSYYRTDRYSQFSRRDLKFEISFTFPKNMLALVANEIEREFHYKCCEIREEELEQIEEARIKEIGEELLKQCKL